MRAAALAAAFSIALAGCAQRAPEAPAPAATARPQSQAAPTRSDDKGHPALGRTSSAGQRGRLSRWITEDELALRDGSQRSGAYVTHLASLLNELWLADRDDELAQRLATMRALLPDASDDRTDARFLRGDAMAAFGAAASRHAEFRRAMAFTSAHDWIGAIGRLRSVQTAQPHRDGRSIEAALLEGDAFAACGRFHDARITWYRTFSTSILQPSGHERFFPAWTSSLRRLVHFRRTPDHAAPSRECRQLPAPLIDPV